LKKRIRASNPRHHGQFGMTLSNSTIIQNGYSAVWMRHSQAVLGEIE
jgi:hypothetical protein